MMKLELDADLCILQGVGEDEPEREGCTYVFYDGPITWSDPRPACRLRFIDGAPVWEDTATIEQAHAIAWSAIKAAREAEELQPFEFEGGMYDPNKENISGAALAALLAQLNGQAVTREWTLADNSTRTLTGDQVIALGIALTNKVDSLHAKGRALRDQLAALMANPDTTPADLYAVQWTNEVTNASQ